ncbi:MAG: YraN family protein, partial [bacterium]
MNKKQKIGLYGEELAEKFFLKKGYKILDKRFQTRFGEIDLVISKDEIIVFVEVKTRTTNIFGSPEESINYYKIKKMKIAATQYVQKNNIKDKNLRLDCLAIELDLIKKTAKLR